MAQIEEIRGEFTKSYGNWFFVPGGYWERRRLATAEEIKKLETQ